MNAISRRLVLLAALALGACSADPVPLNSYYRIDAATPPARTGGPIQGVAEVPPLRGEGIVNDRAILYRVSPSELRQYSYHFWADGPTAMLQGELVDALRGAGAFTSVVTPDMRVNRDYEILGRVAKLEHDAASGSAKVVIEIEISVRAVRDGRQVLLKTYIAEAPASSTSVPDAVSAFSQAFSKIAAEFVADLGSIS